MNKIPASLRKICSVLAAITVSCAVRASAQTVLYDDLEGSSDYAVNFSTGPVEVGNDITLAYPNAIATNFNVQYFFTATNGVSGNETAQVRFYLNDGALVSGTPSPGTKVYDSGVFNLNILPANGVTPRSILAFDLMASGGNAMNLTNPLTSLTWTIQFNHLSASESAGLTIYDPATAGGNHPTYWQNDGTGWQLEQVAGNPSNFGAQVYGTIPQLSTLTLPGGNAQVTFPGVPGYKYVVQRSTDLTATTGWKSISTNSTSTDVVFTVTDTFPDLGSQPGMAFYRLLLP
jgi:hypothetical protein